MTRRVSLPMLTSTRCVGHLRTITFVVGLLGATLGHADDALSLVPLPLARPKVTVSDTDPRPLSGRCGTGPLPQLSSRLPWGPGEHLGFDITYLGIRTGRVSVMTGERQLVDDVVVYPVRATARTDGFLAVFGELDANMVTQVTPTTSLPVRMANHVVVREPFKPPSVIREDGAFSEKVRGPTRAAGGRVRSLYEATVDGTHKKKRISLSSRADVVDVLSVMPWLRSRDLHVGDRFCVELFHRRRLYRVEGHVGGRAHISTGAASRQALRIDVDVLRVRGKTPRPMQIWMSDDEDRLPLLVKTPEAVGDIEVQLQRYRAGRPLVHTQMRQGLGSPGKSGVGEHGAAGQTDTLVVP